jgi:hypothetical protein
MDEWGLAMDEWGLAMDDIGAFRVVRNGLAF